MAEEQPITLTPGEMEQLKRTGCGVHSIAKRHGCTIREAHRVVSRIRQQIAMEQQQNAEARRQRR